MDNGPYCWICGNYVEEAEKDFQEAKLLTVNYNPKSRVLLQLIQVTMVFCSTCSAMEHVQRHLKKAKPKRATKPKLPEAKAKRSTKKEPEPVEEQAGEEIKEE